MTLTRKSQSIGSLTMCLYIQAGLVLCTSGLDVLFYISVMAKKKKVLVLAKTVTVVSIPTML